MSKGKWILAVAAVAVIAVIVVASLMSKPAKYVTIGTGSQTGVYYHVGNALASFVNADRDRHGLSMTAEVSAGSVLNINSVLSGDMDFGLAQSDRLYQAAHGLAEWTDVGPRKDLRVICTLHPEMVTLVAAEDTGVRSIADLRGKVVNIGNPGSGQRGNAIDVLTAAGLDWENDLRAEGLKAGEQSSVLQDGRLDAFFYTVGHPNGSILEATAGQRRQVRLIPVPLTEKLRAAAPYYVEGVIPIALYPKAANTEDVPTIGVLTVLVTSARVPDDTVYTVTKTLFEHLDEFKSQHSALADLKAADMVTRDLGAPLHPGAAAYFKEAGLIQ